MSKLENSFFNKKYKIKDLKPMPKLKIVCGKKYGLPFNYLMTDIYSGCLNYNSVCYHNCTAALFWLENGYDFGKKVMNEFDSNLFEKSLDDLPKSQKWLRQGWISDCSFTDESWNLIAIISDILAKRDIRMIVITKVYKIPNIEVIDKLSKNKTEIRVSLSALDSPSELKKRMNFLELYRQHNGISIPYVMSALYNEKRLNKIQQKIIDFVVQNDFIAGEHPLRINKGNPILKILCNNGFYHPKYKEQYWFGRVLNEIPNFILPPPTYLPENYRMDYITYSDLKKNLGELKKFKNLPTMLELKQKKYTKEMYDHAAYSFQEK